MDAVPAKLESRTEAEWSQHWRFVPSVPKVVRQLAGHQTPPAERLNRAAYFIAGKLEDEDFHLFANAGQPLLKRQRDAWFDEILFHIPPTAVPGCYCPTSIEAMVSFEPLREIRTKISRSYSMVPAFVAKVNIGQFSEPPVDLIWNLEHEGNLTAIGNLLIAGALDWMDQLCNPITLEEQVIQGTLPHVSDSTGLEIVLATGGRHAARQVLKAWMDDPVRSSLIRNEITRLTRHMGPVYRSGEDYTDIAVLTVAFDLLPQRVLKSF